ncbi:hypothetical protein Taro_035155 [Colocasia esculenta]|uniref:Aminotransferase-like plant mobile domain-containing protein n=1 Tax=Colocasia esculenta TaxID=4460 RepID=A0A843VYA0_COLES|nr:hypothetical protein [Colocasia esculenta]
MGFGHLLAVRPFHVDVPYLEALRERWDEDCKAFIMPWGHMIPTLEDVAYLTGLPGLPRRGGRVAGDRVCSWAEEADPEHPTRSSIGVSRAARREEGSTGDVRGVQRRGAGVDPVGGTERGAIYLDLRDVPLRTAPLPDAVIADELQVRAAAVRPGAGRSLCLGHRSAGDIFSHSSPVARGVLRAPTRL